METQHPERRAFADDVDAKYRKQLWGAVKTQLRGEAYHISSGKVGEIPVEGVGISRVYTITVHVVPGRVEVESDKQMEWKRAREEQQKELEELRELKKRIVGQK